MEKDKMCGAAVERGRITEVTETGSGTAYTVESIDRPGAVTLTIPAMGDRLAAGDVVYFSLFPDGTGIILSGLAGKIVKATATQTEDGLMSAADKTKLDALEPGGEPNQNAFSNVKVGSTTIAAQTETDTVELAAGDNVTLTPDAEGKKVTVEATDTTYGNATQSAAGLMSAGDKTKLDGVEDEANKYIHPTHAQRNGFPRQDYELVFGGSATVSGVDCDDQGHVTNMTARTITIPGYTATASEKGLMSATDKSVLDTSAVRGNKAAPSGSTSLDQFTTSGIYWLASSNYPNGWPDAEGTGAKNALLNVYYDGGGARVQILTMYSGTGENRMYCRMYINSQWYAWRQITTGAGIAWSLDIGSQIAANSDLNNFKTPGSYTSPTNITPTLTHKPPTTSNAFILKVMVGHVANTVVQYAIDVTGTLISIRYFNTSSWGSWYKYTGTAV